MAGLTNWDVRVVRASNLEVLSYVPRWEKIDIQDGLSEVGSGKLEMDFNDPFFSTFEADNLYSLLTGPFAIQILRNSTLVFTFLVEDAQVERTGFRQPVTISGRGIGASLEWGIVIPESYSEANKINADSGIRPKYFDRLFKGYEYSARVATTANIANVTYASGTSATANFPGAGATLISTVNGDINTVSPIDGISDLIVGDNILVKNQTNTNHNGVYVISEIGTASVPFKLSRVTECDGSPSMDDLAVGNQCFVSEGVTQNQSAFTLATTPSSSAQVGSQAITFSAATQVYTGLSAFYCLFQECDTGFEYITDKGASFGTQNTSYGRGGSSKSVSWPLSLESTYSTALGLTDSKGQIPKDGGAFTLPAGKNMLETLRSICEQTLCDWRVGPTGEIKIAKKRSFNRNNEFQPSTAFGTDRTTGSNALLISLPATTQSTTQSSMKELKTVVYGSDKIGLDRQQSTANVSIYGTREGYFENTSETAPAVRNITEVGLRTLSRSSLSVDPNITERPNLIAWLSFQVGDWVLVENAIGNFTTRVINGITASVSNNGAEQIQINLDEVLDSNIVKLSDITGYGTSQARNLAVFSEATSIKIPAINSTSVSAATSVTGTSNKAVVSWSAPSIGSPASYLAQTYRVTNSKQITSAERLNGIATIDTATALTGAVVGSLIRISGVGSNFDSSLEKILSISGTSIKYTNQGADEGVATGGGSTVELIGEMHSMSVPSTQTTASFENLSTPGGTYYSTITPVNSNGQLGASSLPITFTSSSDDQIVTAGALRSTTWVDNTSGWIIKANGDAQFNGSTVVRGTIYAGTGLIGALPSDPAGTGFTITSGQITSGASSNAIGISTGTYAFWAGSETASSAPFYVTKAGVIQATSGTIGGWTLASDAIYTGTKTSSGSFTTTSGHVTIGSDGHITSKQFRIDSNGSAYFSGELSVTGSTFYGTPTTVDIKEGYIKLTNIESSTRTNQTLDAGGIMRIARYEASGGTPDFTPLSVVEISGNETPYIYFKNRLGTGTGGGAYTPNGVEIYNYKDSSTSATGYVVTKSNTTSGSTGQSYMYGGNGFYTDGSISFGSTVRQMVNLYGTAYGVGVQSSTLYFRSDSTFAWFKGGSHNNFSQEPGAGGTNVMNINSSGSLAVLGDAYCFGRMGMGNTTQDASNEYVVRNTNGYFYLKTSMRSLKKNIENVSNSLDLIDKLSPVKFNWKSEMAKTEQDEEINRKYKTMGFVLEDVLEVSPELLTWRKNNETGEMYPGYWKTDDFIALAIQGIKDLRAEIEMLKYKIKGGK